MNRHRTRRADFFFPSILLLSWFLSFVAEAQLPPQEQRFSYAETLTEHLQVPYLLLLPSGYKRDGQRWPVLLYLHGAGDRGSDLDLVRRTPAVQVAESTPDFPFIFIAPQEPDLDGAWTRPAEADAVMSILKTVLKERNADPDRVYLTGISMGGWGTWFLAKSFPHTFAAIAPLCGFPDTRWATPELARVPTWTFQGTKDTVAHPEDTENMVFALQQFGGNPKYTPLVGFDHDIAKTVYERKDLYSWFLEHRLSTRSVTSDEAGRH